jgi:5'-nucleotidase
VTVTSAGCSSTWTGPHEPMPHHVLRLTPLPLRLALLLALTLPVSGAESPPIIASSAIATVALPWPPPLERVAWTDPAPAPGRRMALKLLGFNDFHGSLLPGRPRNGRPAGGGAALASYLRAASAGLRDRTLIVHAGDQLGAAPPLTRLLQNEPAIDFLNLFANAYCRFGNATRFYAAASWRRQPNRCNVIGTLGNHEFDAGLPEIRRLLNGGNAAHGPYLDDPWRGSRAPYVSANVIERATGSTALPPYAVVVLNGFPLGVIGATTTETPKLIPAEAAAQVQFLDEADSVNRAVADLKAAGIHTLVVTIHKGTEPTVSADGPGWRGPIRDFVARLDEDVDVVIAGHTHSFTNVLFPNRGGKPVLVTQAYEYGIAYANIDMQVNLRTRDVVAKSALIEPTWLDSGPGLHPDAAATHLTQAAEHAVVSRVGRKVGSTVAGVNRGSGSGGESPLGNLVADALRAATGADMALTNAAAIRSDLPAGEVKWSDVMTALPFENHLVTYELSGTQVLQLLESQWHIGPDDRLRLLKISGLSYVWDGSAPLDQHVLRACDGGGAPLDPARRYRVATNDYLAKGGDELTFFKPLTPLSTTQTLDSEALARHLESFDTPIAAATEGRMVRADPAPGAAPSTPLASLCRSHEP